MWSHPLWSFDQAPAWCESSPYYVLTSSSGLLFNLSSRIRFNFLLTGTYSVLVHSCAFFASLTSVVVQYRFFFWSLAQYQRLLFPLKSLVYSYSSYRLPLSILFISKTLLSKLRASVLVIHEGGGYIFPVFDVFFQNLQFTYSNISGFISLTHIGFRFKITAPWPWILLNENRRNKKGCSLAFALV